MLLYPFCKINLGLNIVSKRSDGYHNLESLFYPVHALHDALEVVECSGDTQFTSSGLSIDCPTDKNLCIKAYNLLKRDFNLNSVKIHLHKVIPMGAGLGGGSSDATFTLMAINEMFSLKLTKEQLKDYALELGSDTAFFLDTMPMMVTGRGENLSPIDFSLKGYYVTIVKPEIHISTKEAFSNITSKTKAISIQQIVHSDINNWRDVLKNDFEDSIFPSHPMLLRIKTELYEQGALYVSMSGSGSSIYAISTTPLTTNTIDEKHFVFSTVL